MKKQGILNAEIMELIASMGHTDGLVIADAGLPIPPSVWRIDITLVAGIPSFEETLKAVLQELCVEGSVIASEMKGRNQELYRKLIEREGNPEALDGLPMNTKQVPHEEFKRLCLSSRGIIRTGEVHPYANIILYSGVTF